MSEILFFEYPKCSTCQKARKWLEANGIKFTARHIVDDRPTAAELEHWLHRSGRPLKSFFNTSGLKYKALQLKDRLPDMSEQQQIELLSTDGMLVKRPLIIGADFILIGFKENDWQQKLLQK